MQLPLVWAAQAAAQPRLMDNKPIARPGTKAAAPAVVSWAFYRKHTENLLRRYLYASMQIGRAPCLLSESVERGWASSRPIRTFEDALIFVLDVERCLKKLSVLDRQMISRVLVQEYTQTETAALMGISGRTIHTKLPQAIDRLTESLVASNLLSLPD